MKPRIYRRRGEWRCEFMVEINSTSRSWKGAGDTPAEAYESLKRLMGDLSWLLRCSDGRFPLSAFPSAGAALYDELKKYWVPT